MIDPQLLKIRDVCIQRYMRREPGMLLRWIVAQARGSLPDAVIAPFNVHGVGIARKRKDGRLEDAVCVQVVVLRKMAERDLARHGAPIVEKEIEGVLIDVVESGPLVIETQAAGSGDRTALQTHRPLRPGCSISHGNVVFGTLGGFCKSTRTGEQDKRFALSCRHVLAGFARPQPRKEIFQPGSAQAAGQVPRIAEGFTRFIETRNANARPPGYSADAAIAELDPGIGIDADYLGIGRSAGTLDLIDPEEDERTLLQGQEFSKFGRTTGLTVGTLTAVRRNLVAVLAGKERAFNDQFVIRRLAGASKPMSDPGDSGAMVFHRESRRAAGIVIGSPLGADNDEETVVSPIATILRELEVELL